MKDSVFGTCQFYENFIGIEFDEFLLGPFNLKVSRNANKKRAFSVFDFFRLFSKNLKKANSMLYEKEA